MLFQHLIYSARTHPWRLAGFIVFLIGLVALILYVTTHEYRRPKIHSKTISTRQPQESSSLFEALRAFFLALSDWTRPGATPPKLTQSGPPVNTSCPSINPKRLFAWELNPATLFPRLVTTEVGPRFLTSPIAVPGMCHRNRCRKSPTGPPKPSNDFPCQFAARPLRGCSYRLRRT